MKSFAKFILPVVGILFLISAVAAFAEEKKAPTQDEGMAIYMKYAAPGPNHKLLEPLVGSWNVTTRMWMYPTEPVDTSSGTSESKWIMGGRYVSEEVTGSAMGMPFHGMGITGYDNYNQKFVNVWLDEMSTGLMLSSGKADSSGKLFTMTGTYDDYITGMKNKPFKTIIRIIGNDKHVNEMYDIAPDGKEFKNFEATYTRKK
jgi:hypothetical protein